MLSLVVETVAFPLVLGVLNATFPCTGLVCSGDRSTRPTLVSTRQFMLSNWTGRHTAAMFAHELYATSTPPAPPSQNPHQRQQVPQPIATTTLE